MLLQNIINPEVVNDMINSLVTMADESGKHYISRMLEYAFSESCLAHLSKALGKEYDVAKYSRRAQSYRNIFDTATGWFRPKMNDGS